MVAHTPEAVHAMLEDAFNRADLDALVAVFEPGATMIAPPEGHAVHGHDAIRRAVEPFFARYPQLTSEVEGRVQSDGLAMTHARWHLVHLDDDGSPVELVGRGTVVSRLQPDGTWRIVLDNPLAAPDREGAVVATGQSPRHVHAGSGATYLGPGDLYRFLVTGAETGGGCFAMEATVAPGGGPPPHVHRREDETFYVLEGECRFQLGDAWITAGVGDFVNVPRGTVHRFHNHGSETTRLLVTFTPAGIEGFFQETLRLTLDPTADGPDDVAAIAARFATAAPRYGIEFLIP